jgi:hypothetical protein
MVPGCGTKILVSNETDGESHYLSKKSDHLDEGFFLKSPVIFWNVNAS